MTRNPSSTKRFWRHPATRWVLAPVLAAAALLGWAFASPIGAGPDDDFHLVSVWCANGGSEYCEPGPTPETRLVSQQFEDLKCFAMRSKVSAACQVGEFPEPGGPMVETNRGNFTGKYPPVYYSVMRLFAGQDVESSAMTMRVVTILLFVGLSTALAALLSPARRRTLFWGWVATVVPLGMFILASNNPSSWSVIGVGLSFMALRGWFEAEGRARWGLAAMYLVTVVMAGGSRGDAAVYAAGGTLVVLILTAHKSGAWVHRLPLPAVGLVLSLILYLMSGQGEVVEEGFGDHANGGGSHNPSSPRPTGGIGLIAYNVLMLPDLWTGIFGSWALGWFDVVLPAMVTWAAAAAFIVVGLRGLSILTWRKVVSIAGVFLVLIVLPVYTLSIGGHVVGENFQPRYLLPLMVLFALVLIDEPPSAALRFTRVETAVVVGAIVMANFISLQVNIRRYVTGTDEQGPNLDAGAEWWWPDAVFGPNATWLLGSLAFAGFIAAIWPVLRNKERQPEVDLLASPAGHEAHDADAQVAEAQSADAASARG